MNRRRRTPPDETLTARRPLYAIAVVLWIVGFLLTLPLLYVAGLIVLLVTIVPEIWYRFGLRDVPITRQLDRMQAAVGDTVQVTLTAENRKPLPLPSIELEDEFPSALPVQGRYLNFSPKEGRAVLTNTLALWAYQRVRRRVRLRATARGAYDFGPMTVRTSDPFGLLTCTTNLPVTQTLLVHPIVAPLERFGLPAYAPFGEHKAQRRLLEDPLRTAGTRDYVPGDDPRRIHWKATARSGALQSKVYEPSTRHTVAVFLDIRTFSLAHMGYDPDLVELAICATASIANWALEQHYAVGAYSNGTLSRGGAGDVRMGLTTGLRADTTRLRLPPASRAEQLMRILDDLARLLPYYGTPMERVILNEQQRLPVGTTVIYVGTEAVLDVSLILALRRLRAGGHSVTLLLTRGELPDGATRDGDVSFLHDLPIHYIGGKAEWNALVSDVIGPASALSATSLATSLRAGNAPPPAGTNSQPDISTPVNGPIHDTTNVSADERTSTRSPRPLVVE